MNAIKFQCPNCSQHLESGEEIRGAFIDCPKCKVGFMVPCADPSATLQAAGKAHMVGSRRAASGRTVLAFTAILVTGLVVTFAFLTRAGKPASLGKAHAGRTNKQQPAIKASANSSEPMTSDMMSWLPAKARQIILTQAADGEVNSVNESIQEGVILFEVEFTKDDLSRSFSVDADGKLLSFEYFESELPPAVKGVIEKEFPGASISQIEREPDDDGKFLYAMEMVLEGRTNSLTLTEEGDWWSLELELEHVPAPVKQTVGRLWDAFKITGARETAQDGQVSYEFDGEKAEQQHRLTVSPDGRLVGQQDETTIDQVPPLVKSSVTNQVGAGEIIRITKVTYEEAVSYDVTAVKDGNQLEFSVDPAGKVLEPGR